MTSTQLATEGSKLLLSRMAPKKATTVTKKTATKAKKTAAPKVKKVRRVA